MSEPKKDPLIVYHASFSEKSPHELEELDNNLYGIGRGGSFHAGTEEAAKQRIYGLHKQGFDLMLPNLANKATIHKYAINTDVDPVIHDDPMSSHYFKNSPRQRNGIKKEELPQLPEDDTSTIRQYRNLYEDAGSTSFVIPKSHVTEGRVTHLGQQFINPEPPKKPRKGSKAYDEMMKQNSSEPKKITATTSFVVKPTK